MKRFKISLAVVAMVLAIAVSAFTSQELSPKAMFQEAWYEFVGDDPQDPNDYAQIAFTTSDQQALQACPAAEPVCLSEFARGANGEPTGEPITILLGEFTP